MTTVERLPAEQLPVPVRDHPHWRVTFRPATYDEHRVPTLSQCLEIVSKHRVRLRGWDFPPVPPHTDGTKSGSRWIACWSDFENHFEYWRFYQSTQFLYLGSVKEFTDREWDQRLRESRHSRSAADARGFLSITNFVYTVTEIFEFAARLAQAGVYAEPLEIGIRLSGVEGFVLTPESDRAWWNVYSASDPELDFHLTLTPVELVANSANAAIDCIVGFFERFGWLNPDLATIRTDQQKLLTQRY